MMRKFLVVLCLLILSACNVQSVNNPINKEIQDFQGINQMNQEISLENLENKIWIANFIFTSCETVCPPMTSHLNELQKKLKAKNMKVELISFSVDPTVDTPEKLKIFIDKFQKDQSHWHFVTGYSQDFIQHFAKESFQTLVEKPNNSTQVIHGTNFYLINQKGILIKSYDGVQNPPYDDIIKDIQILKED